MEFSCGKCGQVLEATDDLAGQLVECPECGSELEVPAAEAGQAGENVCPECQNAMMPDAVLCVNCGFHLKLGKKLDTQIS